MDNRLATLLTRGSSLTARSIASSPTSLSIHCWWATSRCASWRRRHLSLPRRLCGCARSWGLAALASLSGTASSCFLTRRISPYSLSNMRKCPRFYPVRCQLSADLPVGHSGQTPAVCQPAAPERELLSLRRRVFVPFCRVPDQEVAGAGKNGLHLRAGRQPEYFSQQRRALSGVYCRFTQRRNGAGTG